MAYLVCPHCQQRLSWDFPPGSIFQCARCHGHAIVPGQPPPGGGAYGAPYDPFAPGLSQAKGREISRSHLLAVSPKLGAVRTLGIIGVLMVLTAPVTCGFSAAVGICNVIGLILGLQARGEIKAGRYAETPGLTRAIMLNAVGCALMVLAIAAAVTFWGPLGGTFGAPAVTAAPPPPPTATPAAADNIADEELEPWYETRDRAYDLQTRIEQYKRDFDATPQTIDDVDIYYPPSDGGGESLDTWERQFIYTPTADGYRIVSYGEDGRPGGDGLDTDIEIIWPVEGGGE